MEHLENFVYVNELLILYGSVLTPRQLLMMEDYYKYNLSINIIFPVSSITAKPVSTVEAGPIASPI